MADDATFRLELSGGTADQHEFRGYDGYMSLAGFAWTLSLIANYAETGKIRQRREFAGRDAVRAKAIEEGSILAEFGVILNSAPESLFGMVAGASASALLYSLVGYVIRRNLGQKTEDMDDLLRELIRLRGGDVETLVAITEAPIRQSHGVIGNGASQIKILGGSNIINTFDHATKDYVQLNMEDDEIIQKTVTVSAFSGNSGHGSVFDGDLGRNLPIYLKREQISRYGSVFTWGLHQYVTKTGKKVVIKFSRTLAMDGTPKKYNIISADIANEA